MPKLTIAIDTSELRKHRSLKSEQLQLLAELSKINEIDFYIPELVLLEIISQEKEEINQSFRKIISTLIEIKRKYDVNDVEIENDLKKYREINLKETEKIDQKWNEFRLNNRIKLIRLSQVNNNKKVFSDYKNGFPPFTKVRSRNDLPDSFILHSLSTLNNQKIYFVCSDFNLNNAASDLKNVVCLNSLGELFATSEMAKKIKELEILGDLTKDFVAVEEQNESLKQLVKDYLYESIPIELLSSITSKHPKVDKLVELQEIHYINIRFDNVRLYSDHRIILPVRIKITGIVEYTKEKEKFYKYQDYPYFNDYLKYIKIKEEADKLIILEQFEGTLTTAINIKVRKPLQVTKENVSFNEIRKDLLVSSVFRLLFKNPDDKNESDS